MKKARNEASSRWNFDFDSGKPLNGAFEWEEVASSTAGVTVCNPEKHSFKSSSVSEEDSEEDVVPENVDEKHHKRRKAKVNAYQFFQEMEQLGLRPLD